MKQQVKDLIQKLGEAIHETVAESDGIAEVVREIREQGFDVLLMLEATIGLNEVDEEEEGVGVLAGGGDAEAEEAGDGPFTRNDVNFLKSLRISMDSDNTQGNDTTNGDAAGGDVGGEGPAGPQA